MTATSDAFTIREAGAADEVALRRLAALNSGRVPDGRILVAEVDGEFVAAVPLAGGPAITDPFRATPTPANLIELRAAAAALRHHLSTRGGARPAAPSEVRLAA